MSGNIAQRKNKFEKQNLRNLSEHDSEATLRKETEGTLHKSRSESLGVPSSSAGLLLACSVQRCECVVEAFELRYEPNAFLLQLVEYRGEISHERDCTGVAIGERGYTGFTPALLFTGSNDQMHHQI